MEPFSRIIVGYHGCEERFARDLLLGKHPIEEWTPSDNEWDWLGHGIYFWEHSPERALRWAKERFSKRRQRPAVLGAYIQLGRCFDLLNEGMTSLLHETWVRMAAVYSESGDPLPENRGREGKIRELDCLVINDCLTDLGRQGRIYDTVRGAFLEGEPAFPGSGFYRESHIQVAVRNVACVLGVFRPNLP